MYVTLAFFCTVLCVHAIKYIMIRDTHIPFKLFQAGVIVSEGVHN